MNFSEPYSVHRRETGHPLIKETRTFAKKSAAIAHARSVAQSGAVATVSKYGAGVRVATIYPCEV